jgi:putative endonuclease
MRIYYVYMLRCFDGTFYIGITNDLERRYGEHVSGHNPKCYTAMRRPLGLVYAGEFDRPLDAIAFEKQLKGWSHRKKRAFAERDWPLLKRFALARVRSAEPGDCGGPATSSG